MEKIENQVSLGLILLWSHERGEMCRKMIFAAKDVPKYSLVDKAGAEIDIAAEGYDATHVYGVHIGDGVVCWAHCVFNKEYIGWPESIISDQKDLIVSHLEKTFLIIK